jgi:hypothetical protein
MYPWLTSGLHASHMSQGAAKQRRVDRLISQEVRQLVGIYASFVVLTMADRRAIPRGLPISRQLIAHVIGTTASMQTCDGMPSRTLRVLCICHCPWKRAPRHVGVAQV